MSSIFVSMTDNFMSGWGEAEGRTNKYVIECDTLEQADKIVSAAGKRDEMSKIRVLHREPKTTARVLVSLKHFRELGEIWTGG